ncbi:MAG: phage tail protein [Brevundimonas sp.]|uniref:phage tail protein n=1 Tax=Brevundimonas sp. TaxID=1871086 RepID=UPI00391C2CE7
MPFALPLAATAAAAAAPAAAAAAASTGLTATLVSVASQAAVSMAINAAMSVLSPKVGGSGRPVDWTLNPDAPIPFAFGRVGVSGSVIHKKTFGPDKMYYGFVSVLSGAGPITSFDGFTADDFSVSFNGAGMAVTSEWNGEMWRATRFGAQPDTWLPTPGGLKHNATLPAWASSHRASGKALSMLVMGENSKQSAYPTGEVKPLEVIKGLKCWDPRLDSTYPGGSGVCRLDNPATWVWSENPFICALKWCLGLWEDNVGKGTPHVGQQVGGIGSKLSGIDVPAFLAAANVADANGWTCAAYPNTDDDKHQVLVSFFQAGGAIYSQRAGKISLIQRAAPKTSVVTITADDVIGAIEVDTAASRIDRINTIQPTYWSPQHRWQMTALPVVTAQAYRDQDGGKRTRGVTYHYVSNANQAAQLAALDIANAREGMAGQVALKPHLQRIQPGDTFTISEPGFLLDGVKCLCMNTEYDPAEAVVRVTFISETDAKYPFALGQSTIPPEPPTLTSPNDPVSPPLPEDWNVVIRPPAPGGGQVPGFDLTGVVSNDTATAILVEWGPAADGPWTQAYSGPPTATTIPITGVQPNQTYYIAVTYIRHQNSSTRQVYGPYVAPGLVADDINRGGQGWLDLVDAVGEGVDVGPAIAEAEARINDTIDAAEARLDAADLTLVNADAAFNSRLLTFGISPTGTFNATGTLVTDLNGRATVDQLNVQVNRIDGHGSQIGTLTSTVNDIPNNYTSASTFQTLQSEVVAARGSGNANLSARLQQVQQTITDGLAGTVQASEITRLDGRIDTVNGRVNGTITRLDQVDVDLTGKASATSVTNLEAKFTTGIANDGNPDFSDGLTGWAGYTTGTEQRPIPPVVNAVYQNRSRVAVAAVGKDAVLYSVKHYNLEVGRKYRIRTSVFVGAGGASRTYVGCRSLDAAGNPVGGNSGHVYNVIGGEVIPANTGWVDRVSGVIERDGAGLNAGTKQVQLLCFLNYDVTAGVNTAIDGIWLEDVTDAEAVIASNARISAVETVTTNGTFASASSLSALSSEIVTARGGAASLNTRLNTVQTDINGRATATSVSNLSATVSGHTSAISGLQTVTSNGTFATASTVSNLSSTVGTHTSQIGALQTVTSNGTFASASSVSTLSSTVGTHTSQISTLASTDATIDGKVNAKIGVVLNANGKISGWSSVNNGTSSEFAIQADIFRVSSGASTVAPFTYSGGVLSAGSLNLSGSININNRFIVAPDGTMTLQSATSGARTVQTNQTYEVYDANNVRRVRLGVW